MSVKVVIILGVVLVVLFVVAITAGACRRDSPGSFDDTMAGVQQTFASSLTRPLDSRDLQEPASRQPPLPSVPCLPRDAGCPFSGILRVTIQASPDQFRPVRRAT